MVAKALGIGADEINELQRERKEAEAKEADKIKEVQKQEKEMEHLDSQVAKLWNELDQDRARLDSAQRKVDAFTAELKALRRMKEEAETDKQSNATFNRVKPDPGGLDAKISTTRAQLGEADRELSTKRDLYDRSKEKHSKLKSEADNAMQKLQLLKKECRELAAHSMQRAQDNDDFRTHLQEVQMDHLVEVMRLLLQKGANSRQSIDKDGRCPLVYLVNAIHSKSTNGEKIMNGIKALLGPDVKEPPGVDETGKALLLLADKFEKVDFCNDGGSWWTVLMKAIVEHDSTDRNYKGEKGRTPLLALMAAASKRKKEDPKSQGKGEEVFKSCVITNEDKRLPPPYPLLLRDDGPLAREMLIAYCQDTETEAIVGVLYYLLYCHIDNNFLGLKSLREPLKKFLSLGLDPRAEIYKGSRTGNGVRPAHLRFMYSLCLNHGKQKFKGMEAGCREEVIKIMEVFLDHGMRKRQHGQGDFYPDSLGKNGEYGYTYYVWRLALHHKKLSLPDVEGMLNVLMQYGLDANEHLELADSKSLQLSLGGVIEGEGAMKVTLPMLALDFIQKLPPDSLCPTEEKGKCQSTQLIDLLIGKKEIRTKVDGGERPAKFANPINLVRVNKVEGSNTVLHYLLKCIVQLCCWEPQKPWGTKADRLLEAFAAAPETEFDTFGEQTIISSEAGFEQYVRLRAVLEMTKSVIPPIGTRDYVIHQDADVKELVSRLHKVLDLKSESSEVVEPSDVLFRKSGLSPLESLLHTALQPVLCGCEDSERRFSIAQFMTQYLLYESDPAEPETGPEPREDHPNHIMYREIVEDVAGKKILRYEPVELPSGKKNYARFVPPSPLIWLLRDVIKHDPELTSEEARGLDPGKLQDRSPVLRIARIILERGADKADARYFKEVKEVRKEPGRKSQDKTTGRPKQKDIEETRKDKEQSMKECPLMFLALDSLLEVSLGGFPVPTSSLAAVIGLLLEFNANPTLPDQDQNTILMRIIEYSLSKEVIKPFMSSCGKEVEESKEEEANAEIDNLSNVLLDLKSNRFVKQQPKYANLANLDGKTAFLLGVEALIMNKHPIGNQRQIMHQLETMGGCPLIKDRKGSDAADLLLNKSKDRDAKEVMSRIVSRYEKWYELALSEQDIPFLEKLVLQNAIDVTARMKSGDSLVIWAAKNGRADTLKALLDADTTGKIFQDESICFIQNGHTILHIAVREGTDSTHHDVVMHLLGHKSCSEMKQPLSERKCDGKFARDLLEENGDKKSGMAKLFELDREYLEVLLKKGKGTSLVASIFRHFLDNVKSGKVATLMPPKLKDTDSSANGNGVSTPTTEGVEGDKSKKVTNSPATNVVSDFLRTRYADSSSILMLAAKLGDADLVECILDVCDLLETCSPMLTKENGGLDELDNYLNQDMYTQNGGGKSQEKKGKPEYRTVLSRGIIDKTTGDQPAIGYGRQAIPAESKQQAVEWFGQQYPRAIEQKVEEVQEIEDNHGKVKKVEELKKISFVGEDGKEIAHSTTTSFVTVADWSKELASITKRLNKNSKQTKPAFFLRRHLLNRYIDDEDCKGWTALDHAMENKDAATQSRIVLMLREKGAKHKKAEQQTIPDQTKVKRVPDLEDGEFHLFVSYAQSVSQPSMFAMVGELEKQTNNGIKIWTDQQVHATIESMTEGVGASKTLLLYLTHQELVLRRIKDLSATYPGDEEKKGQERVEDWLKRTERVVEKEGRKYYDHPATLWRAYCLFELACYLGVHGEGGDEEREIIFVAEGDVRYGGSGKSLSGAMKGKSRPYIAQLKELDEVMKDEQNRLHGQDGTGLTNEKIRRVVELLKTRLKNSEILEWSNDRYMKPGITEKLLDLKILPSLQSVNKENSTEQKGEEDEHEDEADKDKSGGEVQPDTTDGESNADEMDSSDGSDGRDGSAPMAAKDGVESAENSQPESSPGSVERMSDQPLDQAEADDPAASQPVAAS